MEKNNKLLEFIQNEIKKYHKQNLLESKKRDILRELNDLQGDDLPFASEIEEPNYEIDCFIEDKPSGGYDVACSGEYLGNFESADEGLEAINNWREENRFFPTIWFISDHGNYWPVDEQGNEITLEETKGIKAMYRKAGMKPPHPGKGIHTKKFHKCVTSVGGKGDADNPYAVCMASLGKEKAVKASHRTDEEYTGEFGSFGVPLDMDNSAWSIIASMDLPIEDVVDEAKLALEDGEIDEMDYNKIINYLERKHNTTIPDQNTISILDLKHKIINQAGEIPEKGVDLRFNTHNEPYIFKTMETPEVNIWIERVKKIYPKIYVSKFKEMQESYDIQKDLEKLERDSNRIKFHPSTIKYAEELANISSDVDDMIKKQVDFFNEKNIGNSQQISHIIDQAATLIKNR